jgi:5-formyltetrahydrofolate cyclo-ligase
MPSKASLRTHFQNLRNALSTETVTIKALAFREKLEHLDELKTAQRIGAYWALGKELNLAPSLEFLHQQGKEIFIPQLHPWRTTFWFAPWHPNITLRKNKFGIFEPESTLTKLLAPWELDLVFVPLVAVDQQRQRLGMGQGYYDRSFAFKKHERTPPLLIGCAYEFQQSKEDLCATEHDVKLDKIISV